MLRNVIKTVAWLVFLAAFLVVIAFVGIFHFGLLEFGINRQLKEIVGAKAPVDVTIGAIEGDYFSVLEVRDVQVQYNDGTLSYPLAEIPRIRAMYSLADIWRGKLDVSALVIDSARFTVIQDTSGQWLFPLPAPRKEARRQTLPEFSVDLVAINNASVTLRGVTETWRVDSLSLLAGIQAFAGAYSLDMRAMTMSTDFHDGRVASARGKFTISGERFVFKDVEFDMQRLSLETEGHLALDSLKSGHVEFKSLDIDLGYLGEVLGKDYRGQVSLTGSFDVANNAVSGPLTISGGFQGRSFERLSANVRYADGVIRADTVYGSALDGCRLDGTMTLDLSEDIERYQFDGSLENLNIANLANGAVQTDLNGRVTVDGVGLRSSTMNIDISADLDESHLGIFHVHRATGDLRVNTDSLRLFPGFSVEYFENRFTGAGKIEYSGDLDLRGRAELNHLDRFDGKTFIDDIGGRAQATFALTGALGDPNVSGSLYSDSLWLYELYSSSSSYTVSVDRFLTRRLGVVEARIDNISAWEFPLDSVSAKMRIDTNVVYFDTLLAHTGEAHLATAGELDYAAYPQPIKLHDLTFEFHESAYRGLDTALLLYDTAGIEFIQAPLKSDGESVRASGRIEFDRSFDMNFDLERVNIAPWTTLAPKIPRLGGSLTCSASVVGDTARLSFNINGRVDSLSYKNLKLGDLAGNLRYADRLLHVDTLHLYSPGGNHSLVGIMPMDLRIDGLAEEPFPGEQRLELRSTDTEFSAVSFFLPQIEDLQGALNATATLGGTPFRPQLNGHATFRGGFLKIYELEVPAESLHLDFTMRNQYVTIDSGVCVFPPRVRTSAKERFDARKMGRISIGQNSQLEILGVDSLDYNVTLKATNIPVDYTLGAFAGKADAELQIKGVTPPVVTGKLNLISGVYEEEFLPEDAGYVLLSQFERPESWNIDVDVTMVSNSVVRNSDMDAEFKGTANALRDRGLWSFVYDLEVIRGRVFLPASTFRLDAGGTVVNDDFSVNNPHLDLIARRKVRVPELDIAESGGAKSRQVDAVIQVTGTLDNPIISYYDDPSINDKDKISQDQLYEYLALGFQLDTRQSGWQTASASAVEGAATILSANLTRAGARTIGVETFEIIPDLDVERTEVTFGKYLSSQLYGYYKSDIGITGQEVGFEYYIGRHFLLQGKRDENDHYFFFLNWGVDW